MSDPSPDEPRDFPTTHWSLIGRGAADDPAARRQALDELAARYRPALVAYLVDDARDFDG